MTVPLMHAAASRACAPRLGASAVENRSQTLTSPSLPPTTALPGPLLAPLRRRENIYELLAANLLSAMLCLTPVLLAVDAFR